MKPDDYRIFNHKVTADLIDLWRAALEWRNTIEATGLLNNAAANLLKMIDKLDQSDDVAELERTKP